MHVERFESALWQTASLLLVAGDEAVVIDPCISAEEVARIADRATSLGARVTHVLVTHADWDHVCGIAAFPDAVATMGAEGGDRGTETRVYSVVERPSRLVFRYSVQGMGWPQLVETEMTITFEDQGGKTLVAMLQTGFERAEDRDRLLYGWPVYLDILQTIVASKGAV